MATIKLELASDASSALGQSEQLVTSVKNVATEYKTAKAEGENFIKSATNAGNAAVKSQAQQIVSIRQLTQEYKKLQAEANAAGGVQTAAGRQLLDQAGKVKEEILKLQAATKAYASETRLFDTVAGGFKAITASMELAAGAQTLLGGNSKQYEEVMKDLLGVMALNNAATELYELLNAKSAFVLGITSAATEVYGTATAILTGELTAATIAQRAFSAAMAATPIGALLLAISATIEIYELIKQKSGEAAEESAKAITQLSYQEQFIKEALERTNQERTNAIALLKAQGAETKAIYDAEQNLIKGQIESQEKLIANQEKLVEEINKQFNAAEAGSEEEQKYAKADEEAKKKLAEQQLKLDDLKAQSVIKQAEYNTKKLENEKAYYRAVLELQLRASREAEAFLNPEQRIEAEQKINLQSLQLLRDQIKQENKERGMGAVITEAQEKQLAIIKDSIFAKSAEDRLKLFRQEESDALNLMANGREKEIEATELKYAKLLDSVKAGSRQYADLINKQNADIAAIDYKYNLQSLEANEAHQISLVNQLQRGGMSELAFEKLKAQEKLAIEVKYGEDKIALIESQIPAMTEEEKKAAQAQIDAIKEKIVAGQNELNKLQASQKFSMSKLLFGDITDSSGKSLNSEADAAINKAIDSITSTLTDATDTAIANNKAYIDSLNEKIQAQEDAVNKEDQLAKKGLANSVNTEKKKLAELHKQQQDAVAKQKQLAQEKAAIEAVSQAVSLITAAAEIYSSLASAGPIGVAIAGATIAAMIAAFVAGQVKAQEAANAGSFEVGGYTGDGHFKDEAGVVHKQEFVFDHEKTQRYRGFFESLHNDDRVGIAMGISDLLAGTGVILPDQKLPQKLTIAYEENQRAAQTNNTANLEKELVQLRKTVESWKDQPRRQVIVNGKEVTEIEGLRRVTIRKA